MFFEPAHKRLWHEGYDSCLCRNPKWGVCGDSRCCGEKWNLVLWVKHYRGGLRNQNICMYDCSKLLCPIVTKKTNHKILFFGITILKTLSISSLITQKKVQNVGWLEIFNKPLWLMLMMNLSWNNWWWSSWSGNFLKTSLTHVYVCIMVCIWKFPACDSCSLRWLQPVCEMHPEQALHKQISSQTELQTSFFQAFWSSGLLYFFQAICFWFWILSSDLKVTKLKYFRSSVHCVQQHNHLWQISNLQVQ